MEVRVGILNIGTGKGLASMILISFIMIIITRVKETNYFCCLLELSEFNVHNLLFLCLFFVLLEYVHTKSFADFKIPAIGYVLLSSY